MLRNVGVTEMWDKNLPMDHIVSILFLCSRLYVTESKMADFEPYLFFYFILNAL